MSDFQDPKLVAETALQIFFNVCKLWELTEEQEYILLGISDKDIFYKLKSRKTANSLEKETLERISHLLNIYKNLNILLGSPEAAKKWIKKPNKADLFKGESALFYMLKNNLNEIYEVHKYLFENMN